MDLRRVAIGFLFLAACGTSPDAHYEKGRLLLKQGKFDDAAREAKAGFDAEKSWRFRVLEADIALLARSDTKGAKELLSFTPRPTDPETLARLLAAEAWSAYLGSDYSGAEALLKQASDVAKPLNLPLVDAMIENR